LGRDAEPRSFVDPPAGFGSNADALVEGIDGQKRKPDTGQPFWQDESFDHYLRAASRLDRTIAYIEQNPVSAGLVCSAEHWPWSSAGWQAKPPAPPTQPRGKV